MEPTIDFNYLRYSYRDELIKAGVPPEKAEQAARSITTQELILIGEIWGQWATILSRT
jgi:hypothetical protein